MNWKKPLRGKKCGRFPIKRHDLLLNDNKSAYNLKPKLELVYQNTKRICFGGLGLIMAENWVATLKMSQKLYFKILRIKKGFVLDNWVLR